jgi:hypothetical protein
LPRRNGVKVGAVRRRKTIRSREDIHALRGKIKLNIGGKPFSQWWTDHKREEKELEERRFQRLSALGKE